MGLVSLVWAALHLMGGVERGEGPHGAFSATDR